MNKTLIGRLLTKTTIPANSTSQLNSTHGDMSTFKMSTNLLTHYTYISIHSKLIILFNIFKIFIKVSLSIIQILSDLQLLYSSNLHF